MPIVIPLALVALGVAAFALVVTTKTNDEPPVHEPDAPPMPGKTGYKLVDKILDQLKAAAQASGIPLGLIIGWIAKESGGRLDEVTKYDERGYFQLMPDESKRLGLEHERLSSDSTYSINGGLALIGYYSGIVDGWDVAKHGSAYFWRLVKLAHSMGSGAAKKIVDSAKNEGVAGSWESLRKYATAHDTDFLHSTKHSPIKWFGFVDKVYDTGAPFGFGTPDSVNVVGGQGPCGPTFDDIVDPLDALT